MRSSTDTSSAYRDHIQYAERLSDQIAAAIISAEPST